MHTNALQVLQSVFGYASFRGQQAQIIDRIIDGKDTLVLMPTGGGKSLCYQIPALIRPGVAIVVSPLIALMQDQVNALTQLGIRSAFINSSQDSKTQLGIADQLRQGQIDLLYIAPERLLSERMLNDDAPGFGHESMALGIFGKPVPQRCKLGGTTGNIIDIHATDNFFRIVQANQERIGAVILPFPCLAADTRLEEIFA